MSLSERVQKIESLVTDKPSFNPQEHNDKTRSNIAMIFVCGYFIGLGIVLIGGIIFNTVIIANRFDNALILNIKDFILYLTSTIGSPLGFVVGYYFKEGDKKI